MDKIIYIYFFFKEGREGGEERKRKEEDYGGENNLWRVRKIIERQLDWGEVWEVLQSRRVEVGSEGKERWNKFISGSDKIKGKN